MSCKAIREKMPVNRAWLYNHNNAHNCDHFRLVVQLERREIDVLHRLVNWLSTSPSLLCLNTGKACYSCCSGSRSYKKVGCFCEDCWPSFRGWYRHYTSVYLRFVMFIYMGGTAVYTYFEHKVSKAESDVVII